MSALTEVKVGQKYSKFINDEKKISRYLLPLENEFEENFNALIKKASNYKFKQILNVKYCTDYYLTSLFLKCSKFNLSIMKRVIFADVIKLKKLHFIYRIYSTRNWQGEFILRDECQILARSFIKESLELTSLFNNKEIENIDFLKEYIQMQIMMNFSEYYMKTGNVYPAYIEVFNSDKNTIDKTGEISKERIFYDEKL
jgi:hypothetical protein